MLRTAWAAPEIAASPCIACLSRLLKHQNRGDGGKKSPWGAVGKQVPLFSCLLVVTTGVRLGGVGSCMDSVFGLNVASAFLHLYYFLRFSSRQ